MLRPTLLIAAALLAACSLPAFARPRVEISVIDRDEGDWLAPVRHRGQDWIAGTPGHRYSVRLSNTSGERVLVVLSVDGVNAVTGQTAHPSQAGYVLGPWQSTEVTGWRKSLDDVAQFVFTDLPDSYAARTGRPDNVGVIGIAVFAEERPVAPPRPPMYPPAPVARGAHKAERSAAAQADAASAESMPQGIGTGHGEREWSPVSRTGFVRATRHPQQVVELRYDDRASLVARGILPRDRYWDAPHGPHAFPDGFVADPPYRR